jgi:hypothetical protein
MVVFYGRLDRGDLQIIRMALELNHFASRHPQILTPIPG